MKNNSWFLAFGATAPFIIVPIYYMYTYSNSAVSANADIGMLFTMAFLGLPCAVFFTIIFISRMNYLKVKNLPVKQEFMDFFGFLCVFVIIAATLVFLSGLLF